MPSRRRYHARRRRNLTSIPCLLWALFPPHGRWTKAAIIHDPLNANGIDSKAYAKRKFREAVKVSGVS
ncbi:DUF1353 domain-containing protein [Cupriavidus pauculus]|uniref:DUF1353 domain-containing protein n=1 Tax=Cupriavidus pauculus TaxID=82633 RepID=UPI0020A590A8|nr:DUF1353 domain-containing protein [Cupriavidus pauculus]